VPDFPILEGFVDVWEQDAEFNLDFYAAFRWLLMNIFCGIGVENGL